MTNFDVQHSPSSHAGKTFVIRRTVVLHDIQEFVVRNVRDEFEAQNYAEAMIASISSETNSAPTNVAQIRCEIVDPGECSFWNAEETQG
jgi:hypothetical protein